MSRINNHMVIQVYQLLHQAFCLPYTSLPGCNIHIPSWVQPWQSSAWSQWYCESVWFPWNQISVHGKDCFAFRSMWWFYFLLHLWPPNKCSNTQKKSYLLLSDTRSNGNWGKTLVWLCSSHQKIHVERIKFDETFWKDDLLPKLKSFLSWLRSSWVGKL